MTRPKQPDLLAPPRRPPRKRKSSGERIPTLREFRAAMALYAPERVDVDDEGKQQEKGGA